MLSRRAPACMTRRRYSAHGTIIILAVLMFAPHWPQQQNVVVTSSDVGNVMIKGGVWYSEVNGGGELARWCIITRAVLTHGERRDAAVNFDTYWILQRHSAVSLPQQDFLVYTSDRSNAEITHSMLIFTAVVQNHGDSRKSRHMTKITVRATVIMNTWLSYSANKCYNKCSRICPLLCADLILDEFKQIGFIGLIRCWL